MQREEVETRRPSLFMSLTCGGEAGGLNQAIAHPRSVPLLFTPLRFCLLVNIPPVFYFRSAEEIVSAAMSHSDLSMETGPAVGTRMTSLSHVVQR